MATTATITGCTLTGVLSGDTVTCSAGSAAFATSAVGTGKTVTASGITLGGVSGANYALSGTTATTTAKQPVTYALLVIFTVDPFTGERPHDQQAIRDEAHGWLASLDATVHGVNIRKAD